MHFKKGDKIDLYTVVFPHKQGTYAETYRVKDDKGKTCFLKLIDYSKLNRSQIDDAGRVIEVAITKQLHHHNLCQYLASGNIMMNGAQFAWFVTEFVSGETLFQRIIRDNTLSVYEIKTITKAVLSALSYLHSRPVPESFSGVYSIQTDIYSVGAMMYHLLYGKLPWFLDLSQRQNQDLIECILAERDKELELPKEDKYELDDQVLNAIVKALSYDSEDRFQTASEFIKAIDGEVKVERQSTKRKILSQQHPARKPALIPVKKKGEGFSAVAGMEELKQQLREEVIEPLHNPEEYYRYGVTIPNGMLLYGPPGCGKTFFAKHFAEEVGFNYMYITPATLKSRYVNATQENIANMFKEAEANAPTVIFIDEMNELVPNRDNRDVNEMSRSAVNEMLAQMDRTGEKGIFIIGATNYPNMIDPAILRAGRLDKKYYIGVPDTEARIALFRLYLEKRPYDFGLDYQLLAEMTKNYVSADIKLIVNDASRSALRQHCKITMDILKTAISNSRPSLNANELSKYERIRAMMNDEVETKDNPRIGFNA